MASLRSGININVLVALLLAVVFLAAGVGAWASHDCCGHPSGPGRAEGTESGNSGTESSTQDGNCISTCCQTYTVIYPMTNIMFAPDPRWLVAGSDEIAASRVEADIYRPPIA